MADVRSGIAGGHSPTPSRYLYMISLLDFLREQGPSSPQAAYQWMTDRGIARTEDQVAIQKDGGTRFHKEVRFARQELLAANLIRREPDGRWGLTSAGATTFLNVDGARAIVSRRHTRGASNPKDEELLCEGFAPTRGPAPTDWSGTVVRSTGGLSWTYAMRFGLTSIWKIGLAIDVDRRASQLNQHVPIEVIEDRWVPALRHPWPSATAAYAMEQFVLAELREERTVGERVQCAPDRINMVWHAALQTLGV